MRTHLSPALIAFVLCTASHSLQAQAIFPVQGFSISAPKSEGVDTFIKFIHEELAPRKVNTLILRVGYNYKFKSHPELADSLALTKAEVKKIVAACKKDNIRIIPLINLLGHQSSRTRLGSLLRNYPQFDETPHIQIPKEYKWPNPDGLYCKSYCPLHPEVHDVVFAVVDEICEVFESNAFHAGMDEVFYLGDEKCPRCAGLDHADLFAGEVTRIRNHLAGSNRELWIWGDRLLDGRATGLGIWEGAYNNTNRAIDLIPKDVFICDWHYERPDKTAVLFAMKGFRVATCPWRRPAVGVAQVDDMQNFRLTATPAMKENYQGMIQTTWSSNEDFLKGFYANDKDQNGGENTHWHCFRAMYDRINTLRPPALSTPGSQ